MGERVKLCLFKGPNKAVFLSTLETVVERYGGKVFWETDDHSLGKDMRTAHRGNVQSAFFDDSDIDFLVPRAMARILKCPWFSLRIQEGSLWDYDFYVGDKHVDSFSTLPQYWDDDPRRIALRKGNPELVARLWDVPLDRIKNYLVNWGLVEFEDGSYAHVLKDKAYDSDRYDYGDIWQLVDFIEALGGWFPVDKRQDENDKEHHGVGHRFVSPSKEQMMKDG